MLIGFRWVGGGGMESPGYVLFPHQFATRPLAERLRLMEVPCCKVGGWVGSPSGWSLGSRCRRTNPIKTPWHTHTHTVMMMPEQLLLKSYVPIVGQQQQQQQELICVLFTLHHGLTLSLHPLYTCVCVQPRKKIIKPQSIIFQLTLSPSCHACQQSKFTGYSN
jgi:hypothetical protein